MSTLRLHQGYNLRSIAVTLLASALAACGGSDERTIVEQYGLRAEAEAWENHMPTVLLPGQEPLCNALIVRFAVTSEAPLPAGTTASVVVLAKASPAALVELPVSSPETGLRSPTMLEGVARGCRSQAFADGDELDAAIRVRSNGAEADVRTIVRLYYAS